MDDLFKILIWGVIIFSFLKPLFKKKEQQKEPPIPGTKPSGSASFPTQHKNADVVTASKKQGEYDILRELENMFKGNIKIPDPPKPIRVDPYDIYQSHEIKDKDLNLVVDKRLQRSVQDDSPIGSRPTYDDLKITNRKNVSDRQREPRKLDAKIEANAKSFERVLAGPRKQRAAITDFNRKLKNPRTVREYILFSEILGKPKALR
jgi:hypothetical protein